MHSMMLVILASEHGRLLYLVILNVTFSIAYSLPHFFFLSRLIELRLLSSTVQYDHTVYIVPSSG